MLISREVEANNLIFATDVSGIYNKNPKTNTDAVLLNQISINEIKQIIEKAEESGKVDASGGMKGKLTSLISAIDLIKKGLRVAITCMLKCGNLKSYLEKKSGTITEIIE